MTSGMQALKSEEKGRIGAAPQPRIRLSAEGYPYTYARISARRGRLFARSEYQKLLKLELNGIIRSLEESSYRAPIDSLVKQYSGVELIERALNLDMVSTAQQLRRISPEEVRLLVDAFMARWDVHNVKTIIRGLSSGAQKEHVLSLLIPAGRLSMAQLQELLGQEDAAAALRLAPVPGARAALAALKEQGLAEAENCLDRAYFEQGLGLASRISDEGEPFARFLREEIDVVNIKTLLRLKRLGVPAAQIERHLIGGGGALDAKRLRRLAGAEGMEALAAGLKRTPYKAALESAGDDIVDAELELEKLLVRRSFLFTRQHPLTVMSILSYLLAKVTELKNLKTIVKAKQLGLESEFIERKLVVI